MPTASPLLINDRVDIALLTGADGVHLGQRDMSPREARRLLGDYALIGLTCNSAEDLTTARTLPIDSWHRPLPLHLDKEEARPHLGA